MRVRYLDDGETITYGVAQLIAAATLAPTHVDPVEAEEGAAVAIEQTPFQRKPRGDLLPLQRKKLRTPTKWLVNIRKFDDTFGDRVMIDQDADAAEQHTVPMCGVKDCCLDCSSLTVEIVMQARAAYREASL